MKKLFFIAGIAILPTFVFAQSKPKPWEGNPFVTDTAKNIATEQYCVVKPEKFGTQIKLSVDFGEPVNQYSPYYLLDNNHKDIKFNSIVNGLNYMARQGWVFVSTVINRNDYASYVLRRSVEPITAN